MSSSRSVRSEGEMVPRFRPLMSVDLFHEAINGTMNMNPVAGEHQQHGVAIEIEPNQTQQDKLQHVTRSGDTLLHLLVTNRHNNLALKVFESHPSLLEAQNMMLETPLHSAAKVGNDYFISTLITSHPLTVKEVLRKTNKEGDTAMHVAAKHGCKDVGHMLMKCDVDVAYDVNNKMLSPLNIAIIKENLEMVEIMVREDPTLASTQFSNGMFPVHLAARMGQTEMVMHFIGYYPRAAKLLDHCGRNILHIATEEGQNLAAEVDRKLATEEGQKLAAKVGWKLATEESPNSAAEMDQKSAAEKGSNFVKEMLKTMNDAKDYEGNSLLHVAAMKGHLSLMKNIWEKTIKKKKNIWEKLIAQFGKKDTQGLPPIENTQGLPQNTHGLTPIENTQGLPQNTHGLTPIENTQGLPQNTHGLPPIENTQGLPQNSHGLTPIDLFVRQLRATPEVGDSLARTIDQKKLSQKWFNDAVQLSLKNQWERAQVIGLGSVLITTVTFAAAFTFPGGYNQNDGTPLLGRSYKFRAFIIANTFAFIYGYLSLYILLKGAAQGRPGHGHLCAIDTFLLAAFSMLVAFGLGLYVMLASVCRPLAIIVISSTFIICFLNNFNVRVGNRRNGLLLYAGTFLLIFGLAKV